MDYRVEDKYLITEDKIAYLQYTLKELCSPDPHCADGSYLIRSAYFDDIYDSCLHDNEAGVDRREKYRIRAYDCRDDVILLECKSKRRGFTRKQSVRLSREGTDALLDADYAAGAAGIISEVSGIYGMEPDPHNYSVLLKLQALMQYRRMRPVITIEYERMAYLYDAGNVRITFDRNIGCSRRIGGFWDAGAEIVPVLPAGMHILEVKYDELLPDAVRQLVGSVNLQKTAFSKYYYGRMVSYTL